MSNAFLGNFFFKRGDGGSPEAFTTVPEVFSIGGLGEVNDLVDVTSFDSAGSREYIAGLADGTEVTIECNFLVGNAAQDGFITDCKNKATRNFQVHVEQGSPTTIFSFAAACLEWGVEPAVDDKNVLRFRVKISGGVTITP